MSGSSPDRDEYEGDEDEWPPDDGPYDDGLPRVPLGGVIDRGFDAAGGAW